MKNHQKTIEYNKLERLHSLKRQKERIAQEEKRLSLPLCNNLEILDKLYHHFMQIVREMPNGMCPDRRASRKLFLFIALYLYSPATLTGTKMDIGMRAVLVRVMNLNSRTAVNYYCEGLGLWYTMYPDFRQALDYVFPRLLKAML